MKNNFNCKENNSFNNNARVDILINPPSNEIQLEPMYQKQRVLTEIGRQHRHAGEELTNIKQGPCTASPCEAEVGLKCDCLS